MLLKKGILLIAFSMFSLSYVIAANPDAFIVTVNPNPIQPNQAVDMTIKAVQADGTVVPDYIWTVVMDLEWYADPSVYDMPSNGIYQFTAEDQGVKTFSKWLVIKKSGTYTVKVSDAFTDAVVWSQLVVVGSWSWESNTWQQLIEIISPTGSGTVVEASSINIIGKSDSKRTPLQFFIDGKKIELEWETDNDGNFSVYLVDVVPGMRTIVVKLVDYQWNVIGESLPVVIDYKSPTTDQYLKSFTVTPSGVINAWDIVVIDAVVDGAVRSVELRVGDMWLYPMERKADGSFTKSLVVDTPGLQKVDTTLIFEWGQRTIYTDRATLDVKAVDGVGAVKIVNDIADPKKVNLSWIPIGSPSSYVVRYGTSKDAMSSEAKSSSPSVVIPDLEIGQEYFFQVFAVDANGIVSGKWSDIISQLIRWQNAAWQQGGASSCAVVGIKVRTQRVNWEYFLTWNAVPGATSYSIYRSEFMVNSIDQMQRIWDSAIPQFSYPFDMTAKTNQYAYYSVMANCTDGTSLQVDDIKKIHVWPVSDTIMLLLLCVLCYSLYRMYRFQ